MTESQPATNPFPEMWSTGREALFRAARERPDALCAGLAAASGVSDVFARLAVTAPGPLPSGQVLAWGLGAGTLWGLVRLYVWAAGTWAVARVLGGTGTYRETSGAFAWATLPVVALLLIWVPGVLLFGGDFFLLHLYAAQGQVFSLLIFAVILLAMLGAAAWSLVLVTRSIGLQHRIGLAQSLASVILGLVLVAAAATAILVAVT